ncbi:MULTISPECIES: sensor histidine kinase [unclassified Sphingomonas]|uniref:sensor histidine kinase n=1 Tax=unclassified Sphingomonas TaxID=196159 RepID=UPI00269890F5
MSTPFGAQTAWRQLVDLIGRGRAPASDIAITRLRSIRPQVPATIRAASARALAFARPPAPLVRLFAEEDLAISAPVLRMAELSTDEWIAMLPDMSPAGRSVLRHRRDLSAEVGRALESFGPIDFILPPSTIVPPPEVIEAAGDSHGAVPETDASTRPDSPDQSLDNHRHDETDVTLAPVPAPVLAVVAPEPDANILRPGEPNPEEQALPGSSLSAIIESIRPTEPILADRVPANDHVPIDSHAAGNAPIRTMQTVDAEEAAEAIAPPPEDHPEAPLDAAAREHPAELEPQPEPVWEPLSIDWTAVIAVRPSVPSSVPPKPVILKLPARPPASPPPVAIERATTAPVEAPPAAASIATAAVLSAPVFSAPVLSTLATAEPVVEPVPQAVPDPALSPEQPGAWSFVSIASVAFGLPVVVEALRKKDETQALPAEGTIDDGPSTPPTAPVAVDQGEAPVAAEGTENEVLPTAEPMTAVVETLADAAPIAIEPAADAVTPRGPFQISDLVARIDAFQRQREEEGRGDTDALLANDIGEPVAAPQGFSFETDARGIIRWVSGVSRAALIGVSLDLAPEGAAARVDGVAAGAFRRRSAFAQARLLVDGQSDAAGQWRISGVPAFDKATGRFTGYRGTARRPRADERAEPEQSMRTPATDSLRQLVHELRTPTTAIAGFAEMIEGELLGPVSGPYRDYAGTIRDQAMGLLGAIDDLDTAARIEAHALELRPTDVPVALLLQRIALDLEPLATLRGATLALDISAGDVAIRGDDRAVDRLFARLLAALVAAGSSGETIGVRMGREGEETVAIHIDRPRALAAYAGDALLMIDAEAEAEALGAPLLGTGFALRLARNLAVELGGSLTIGVDRLTLRLPAAFTHGVGQASTI